MVFMCLDHTREFFGDLRLAPEDLQTTTPLLFFTRWVTHFCAPTFVFLAGVSAWFYGQKSGSRRQLAEFLVTRGMWLLFLEFTVVYFGWLQCVGRFPLMFIVIGAIGVSMMALAALVYLPYWAVCCFGLVTVALHNCLDGFAVSDFGRFGDVWVLLHQGGRIESLYDIANLRLDIGYPILAWVGVISCGYVFGRVLQQDRAVRSAQCLQLGLGCIVLFLVLRGLNFYGDPRPWGEQSTATITVLSFLMCTKYPPSLLYLLMTLGPALVVLGIFEQWSVAESGRERKSPRLLSALLVFGRVPLFFYVVHLYLIHTLSRLLYWVARGEPLSPLQVAFECFQNESPFPKNYGFSMNVVYLAWPLMLMILWPMCMWFGKVKRRGNSWIWSYL